MEAEEELSDPWTLFMDGSSGVDSSRAGLIITNPEGAEFTYALRFRFDATNNEAEYEALIAGLRITEQIGVKNLQTNVDSRLVANQVLVEELNEKSINEVEVLAVEKEEGDTTEAVIPAEIGMPTLRTAEIDMIQNDEALEINLNLLEERREHEAIHEARSKAKWKNITTLKSVTQASNLEPLSTGTMMPAMQKIARSLTLSEKDRTR
nr:reverse transcriptase domain-containing protein [Tanacetum cinerariifolium]